MYYKQQTGKLGEEIAAKYLLKEGYSIFERNYFSYYGEIDIIARDKKNNEIVFIEVKTRFQNKYGSPAEAVDEEKANRIYHIAKFFLMIHHLEDEFIRFDVIEVLKDKKNQLFIHHIKNAILEETF